MSSASAVEIIAVPEVVYGKQPAFSAATVADVVRYVSESLSGTPTTTQSQELRRDRMSGGLVVTGLESGGDINIELSKDALYEEFIAGAMMNAWTAGEDWTGSFSLTKDPANEQLATLAGAALPSGPTGQQISVGDVLFLSGFAHAANNGPVQVVSTAGGIKVAVPRAAATEDAVSAKVQYPDHVDIGSLVRSWTLSKAYTDVLHDATTDEHSQRYSGSLVNTMNLNIAYGEIVTGVFGFLANGYEQEHPSMRQQIIAAGGTVTPASTSIPLNGSIDMPMVTVDGQPTDFCIQSLTLSLSNNATPQNCIGKLAPQRYNLGTATIDISASIYLGDASYDRFMPAKLKATPISMLFAAVNDSGGYAFDLRAVQLSFPDPAASGGDQPVLIDASGTAKVGAGGASSLRIWRW
jgi:Phage tail tube protein